MIEVGNTVVFLQGEFKGQEGTVTSIGAEIHTRGRNSCFCFVKLPNRKQQRFIYPDQIRRVK